MDTKEQKMSDKYLTLIFDADELSDEGRMELGVRASAMSWSHAIRERDALAAKLAAGRVKYDALTEQCQEFDIQTGVLSSRLIETQKGRDAIAAHVERIRFEYGRGNPSGRLKRIGAVLDETPSTSLARLKAEWQAEAVVEFGYRYGPESEVRAAIQSVANELRRQAEEE